MSQTLETPAPAPPTQVADLLALSRPRPGFRYAGRLILLTWALVLLGMVLGLSEAAQAGFISVALVATIVGTVLLWSMARAYQTERLELDRLEDAIALKHLALAGPRLEGVMSHPMRSVDNRLRAMLLLASVLSRANRYDDALAVYNELIDREGIAGPGGAMVKVGRAMAMLHTDHLYDADRAINDLRRLIDRGGIGMEMMAIDDSLPAQPANPSAIASLRLVELYRDLKTGHTAEAIELFGQHLPQMRSGLGHRVAEAHALAALAYDRASRPLEAQQHFADATALQPLVELVLRYPELRPLTEKYTPTAAPRRLL
ncbi:MAG: hypothetical protein ACTHLZ_09910 [Tepidisphaeraceae bacterium]